jgi:tRNA modification GTPase
MDSIYAVSSGAPPAAIAVLRVSGPGAFASVRALAGELPPPRQATLRALRDGQGALLDRALLLCFPAPASATGEDVAELHLHGGRAVVRAVSDAIAALPGMRAAEPGEFTRRALMNGRIDLSEAEGLGDLLQAESEAQRRAALRLTEGGLRQLVAGWEARLLAMAAEVEAELDHGDEGDVVAGASLPSVREAAEALGQEIAAAAARPAAERLRDGLRIVLAGPPNAGKSTLLNALVEREAAIVSPIAGTTRDRIEVPVMRDGVAWLFTDTAGLAVTDDPVEAVGVARARAAADAADLVLWLGDDAPPMGAAIRLWSRADLPGRGVAPEGALAVSVKEGIGLDALWQALADAARGLLPPPDHVSLNARHRALCIRAADALSEVAAEPDAVLVAEQLRWARHALHAITGHGDTEALLDTLFARFCIGK